MTHLFKLTAAAATMWLLLPMGSAFSQSVQVKTLSTDYPNKKATFTVSWAAGTRNATHLSKVWVFVDYAALIADHTLGAWQRADLSAPTATAGTITGLTGQGFFLEGTAGAFSATVTVTLTGVPQKFSWCAYATDYPPNAVLNNGTYTLKGTPPFVINGNIIHSANTYSGGLITSLTDETDCPNGIIIAEPVVTTTSPAAVCVGNPVTLTATASGGTTTAMTYTWTVSGTAATTTANSYTYTVPGTFVGTSMTYSVSVTNAYGTASNMAGGSITITSPATNGQTANACGCATGTTNVNGICTAAPAGSVPWTTCSGFSYISNVASEGDMVLFTAMTYCQNKGMRLPTITELQCMCNNKASLPGGFFYDDNEDVLFNYYWSSSFMPGYDPNNDIYYYGLTFDPYYCYTAADAGGENYVKCVL